MENQDNNPLEQSGTQAVEKSSLTSSPESFEDRHAAALAIMEASYGGAIKPGAQLEAEEARRSEDELFQRMVDSGVPIRHLRREVDLTAEPRWTARHREIQDKLYTSCLLALTGGFGPGKTQLAVEACRTVARNGHTVLFVEALEIFMAIKDGYKQGSDSERKLTERFVRPSLLVIDEATERGETAWEDRVLGYILNKRYANERDTILIGNFDRGGLLKSLGSSIMDRMNETGGEIACDWPSFRGAV